MLRRALLWRWAWPHESDPDLHDVCAVAMVALARVSHAALKA